MRTFLHVFKNILFSCFAGIIAFIVLEGFFSVGLFCATIFTSPPLVEESYTEYDPLLGWISQPNIYIPNMFGPGKYLQTNSQRFRNVANIDPQNKTEKTRIICTGDSFTFGHQVSNDNTWCAQLEALSKNLEIINMGQGGYGVGQAYLWYERDGRKLEHDVHFFAFITEDFRRATHEAFITYKKPVLRVEEDRLEVKNVPVPRAFYSSKWITRNIKFVNELRSVIVLRKVLRKIKGDDRQQKRYAEKVQKEDKDKRSEIQRIVMKMFEDMHQRSKGEGIRLIAVHLPTEADMRPNTETVAWRGFLEKELGQREIEYWDLTAECQSLERAEFQSLLDGHYTEKGNKVIAKILYKKLQHIGIE